MANIAKKKNQSSMQVLKTLQVLLQQDYTMQELLDILNTNEEESIFNNSVVSKYINTCRACGIDIPKINGRYYVAKMPFGIEFSSEETELLKNLQQAASFLSVKSYSIFEKFIEKLNRFSNKNIVRVEKNDYQMSFVLFERAISHKLKVKIIFKNKEELICVPIKIIEDTQKTFFNILCKNRERMIDVDRVSAIKLTDEKFISNFYEHAVLFNLKSPLAERYELRENEELRIKGKGLITVSNKGENPEVLISRLLRYDDKCEVLTQSHRDMIKQVINDTLSNYGEV